jgi:hypothetical protein
MDRSFWLSLVALGLGIALLLTGRAVMDGVVYLQGVSLAAEIESLDGAPSSKELADRTTEAAGCIYGNRPRVRTCWYAWAHPERPEYLAVIAQRVQDDSGGSALGYLLGALPFWLLAIFAAWRSTRPVTRIRPSAAAPSIERVNQAQGRLVR